MTIQTYWQIDPAAQPWRLEPSARRGNSLVTGLRTAGPNRFDYYAQIAQAAAQTGFEGAFVTHRPEADDSRMIAGALSREVPRLGFVAEFPASVGSAVYAAKQATTFQRGTHDRFGWAIAPDADAAARARDGDTVPDDQLAARADEFLTVARGVHTQRPFTFQGAHFEVQDGGFEAPLNRAPFPLVFLQGETEEALDLSARHADVHLFRPATVNALAALVEGLDTLAKQHDRRVAFGLILPMLARETEDEAAADAASLRAPPGTLVGSYDTVAATLAEYAALGIEHFVLSADPALEEAYRIGQHVLPRLHAHRAIPRRSLKGAAQ
ncbi:MAG: LLM class flavin-dependent oxidoreductase [Pseudomonadota bacterium]